MDAFFLRMEDLFERLATAIEPREERSPTSGRIEDIFPESEFRKEAQQFETRDIQREIRDELRQIRELMQQSLGTP